MNTTAAPQLTILSESLMAELELIERYGDRFSYTELMDAARRAEPILNQLIEELPDDQTPAPALTARQELSRLFLPNGYTEGLIVAVLMIVRSGIRQFLAASTPEES